MSVQVAGREAGNAFAAGVTALLDVIVPVRPGDSNEELRFTMRALDANYPHANVWIVGHKPSWLTGVEYLPGNLAQHKRANLWHNLLAACKHPDISDETVIFNDDFFITQPVDEIPTLYRGLLEDHIRMRRVQRGEPWWRESLKTTQIILQTLDHTEPLSYELHVPFRCNKHLMAETLERFKHITPENPPQWRSLYGVLNNIGGKQSPDGKAYRPGPLNVPFHSTDDRSFRHFHAQLLEMFPEPCGYEREACALTA